MHALGLLLSVLPLFCLFPASPLSADAWIAGNAQISKVATSGQTLLTVKSVFGRGFAYSVGIPDIIGVDQRNGHVWVSDVNNNRVFQLNADGKPLREMILSSPLGIGIDTSSGAVWTSILVDEITFPRAIIKLDPNTGAELVKVTGFSRFVSAVAVGPSGRVWIADRFNNEVVVLFGSDKELNGYDTTGVSGPHHLRLSGFDEPFEIDMDPGNGSQRRQSIWIADRNNGEAVKISADGTELVRKNPAGFFEVRFVSVNSRDGSIWVGDPSSGRVAKLSALGKESRNLSIPPTALAVDVTDDAVWIGTGFGPDARATKLDSDGFELLSISGLGTISGIRTILSALPVAVDIRPGSFPNSINPRSKGSIPVAILGTRDFDVTDVDPISLQFGPRGAFEVHGKGHIEDVNADGTKDLILHFEIQETGIRCGDTTTLLSGATFEGNPIQGFDSIRVVGCK